MEKTPENRSRRAAWMPAWLLPAVAGLAVALALLVSMQIQGSMADHGHDAWRIFLWQLAGWGWWAAFFRLVAGRGAAAIERHHSLRPGIRDLAWCGLLIVAQMLLTAVVDFALQVYEPVVTRALADSLGAQIQTWGFVDLFLYWFLFVVGYNLASRRRIAELELRESRLQAELARAQLEALQLELQPHFLFNTLHSIAALTRQGAAERAVAMLVGLSDLLRRKLAAGEAPLVSLREELETLDLYLDLQRERFGDRLEVEVDAAADCLDYALPPFVLQPLVENAIRHGLQRRDGGRLRVSARCVDGELRLAVNDDGVGLASSYREGGSEGIGLSNTRRRLRQMYGERARFTLAPAPGGGTVAELAVPAAT